MPVMTGRGLSAHVQADLLSDLNTRLVVPHCQRRRDSGSDGGHAATPKRALLPPPRPRAFCIAFDAAQHLKEAPSEETPFR